MSIVILLLVGISLVGWSATHIVPEDGHLKAPLEIVDREGWGAREPKLTEPMPNPVSHVIIHHSYIPPACSTQEDCIDSMKEIQRMHMDDNGWNDIGYSFLSGGDGRIYEGRSWNHVGAHAPNYNNRSIGICIVGDWQSYFLTGGDGRMYRGRGWNRVGAHAIGYNNRSIGICVVGDWQVILPPKEQLDAVHQLIALGVERGYIAEDYILLGHRQTRPTECPGQALYEEINSWPHYSPCPPPVIEAQRLLQREPNAVGNPEDECPDSKKN